jgi:hypothetical protein
MQKGGVTRRPQEVFSKNIALKENILKFAKEKGQVNKRQTH